MRARPLLEPGGSIGFLGHFGFSRTTGCFNGLGAVMPANRTAAPVREIVSMYYEIDNLTDAEVASIMKASASSMNSALGQMMNTRGVIGRTTGSYTGMDLPVNLYGTAQSSSLSNSLRSGYMSMASVSAAGTPRAQLRQLFYGAPSPAQLNQPR